MEEKLIEVYKANGDNYMLHILTKYNKNEKIPLWCVLYEGSDIKEKQSLEVEAAQTIMRMNSKDIVFVLSQLRWLRDNILDASYVEGSLPRIIQAMYEENITDGPLFNDIIIRSNYQNFSYRLNDISIDALIWTLKNIVKNDSTKYEIIKYQLFDRTEDLLISREVATPIDVIYMIVDREYLDLDNDRVMEVVLKYKLNIKDLYEEAINSPLSYLKEVLDEIILDQV